MFSLLKSIKSLEFPYFRCECKTGFTGTNCEWAIDDCASSPCGVGTCVRNVGRGYTCVCPADRRDYDAMCNPILPCTSNPCRNQATCVSEGQSYRCLCRYVDCLQHFLIPYNIIIIKFIRDCIHWSSSLMLYASYITDRYDFKSSKYYCCNIIV